MGFAPPRGFASLCSVHCSTCVAQVIRGMMICRHPRLPPACHRQSRQSPQLNAGNWQQGLRSLRDLTQHLTTRADDNHAPPVFSIAISPSLEPLDRCQDLVRFFALLRIKPHAPPLVRAPVNSFEFHSCERTTQAEYLLR